MATKDPLQFGPLPKKARSQELETLSLKAFKNLLPGSMFNIRDVRSEDYGVDVQIEVVHNGNPTNFLAHIQLKGTDSLKKNADNSISLQVNSANLNYVLNSPIGIYVLYIDPTKELRYVWASSEYKRIERESPDWRTQGTVSLRFARILDAAAIDEIHERIIEKSVFHRQHNDMLAHKEIRVASGKPDVARITIDTETFTITDATVALQRLKDEGINLVACGQATSVLELAQHVTHIALNEKVAQVVLAYANYSLGHFMQCAANLAGAQLATGSLDPHQQYLHVTLQNACEFHMGDMTRTAFLKSEKDALGHISDPVFKLQAELYYIRLDIMGMFADEDRGSLYAECQRVIAAAKAQDNVTLQLQAEIAQLSIEGNRSLYEFVSLATVIEGKIKLGFIDASAQTRLNEKLNKDFQFWKDRIEKLIVMTKLKNDRLLYADAVLTGGLLLFGFVFNGKHMSIGLSKNFSVDTASVETVIQQIKEASETFTTHNMKHDELRSKMLVADFLHFLGRSDEAKEIARPLLPVANAMQYQPIVEHLEKLLTERQALEDLSQLITDFQKIDDEDVLLIRMDDAQFKSFASFQASCLGMPTAAIYADLHARRVLARERFSWCQHIQLGKSMGLWRCGCPKTGYISATVGRQPEPVFAGFKERYCSRCTLQAPKPQPPTS